MARKNEGEDSGFLSFIDVISCGMGAAVLLFLIFSAMPHSGSVVPSSRHNLAPGGQSAEDRPIGIQSPFKVRVAQLPIEVSVTISGLEKTSKETLQFIGIPGGVKPDVIIHSNNGTVIAIETKVHLPRGLNPANRAIGVRLPKTMLKQEIDKYYVNVRLISSEYYSECICFEGEGLRESAESGQNVKLFNLYATRGQDKWIEIKVPGFDKDLKNYCECQK